MALGASYEVNKELLLKGKARGGLGGLGFWGFRVFGFRVEGFRVWGFRV